MDFLEKIKQIKSSFKNYMDDYYKNATLIFKIIYDNQVFDRYYECMCEFNSLSTKLYSDKHINKLLNSNKKKELGINLLRSRALTCLSIVDEIDKLYYNEKTLTTIQKAAYNSILRVKKELLRIAKDSISKSNTLAVQHNYLEYHFNNEENYFNQV